MKMFRWRSYLAGLIDRGGNATHGHDDDGRGVVDVFIGKPKDDRGDLKNVERVQNFDEEEGQNGMEWNDDHIGTVQLSPEKY